MRRFVEGELPLIFTLRMQVMYFRTDNIPVIFYSITLVCFNSSNFASNDS